MCTKNSRLAIIGISLMTILCLFIIIFSCPHENTASSITIPATCTENGSEEIVCLDCKSVVKVSKIEATGHSDVRNVVVTKNSTCAESGIIDISCSICNMSLDQQNIEKLNCAFGEWTETQYATPFEAGKMARTCESCGRVETKAIHMNMPSDNSVYIPETGICHKIYVGDLTQDAIDTHDLVYDVNYYGTKGPWILGHQCGTLNMLSNTKVGQNIYISIGGNIKTYVVRYSEFAMQNEDWTDIVGQKSGVSVLSSLDGETLHMYTCYGSAKNHRWMVLAELVE